MDRDRLEDGLMCMWLVRLVVAVAVTSLAVHIVPTLLCTLSLTGSRVSLFPVDADDLGLCDLGENVRLVREVADVADAVEVGEVWFSLRADVRDDARRTPR